MVILADRLDMTLAVYHRRKTTKQQTVEPFMSKQPRKRTGPGCSKLTTSLVNVSLKFQMLISQIRQYFLLKKCEKLLQCKSFSHFINKKISVYLVIRLYNT